MLLSIVDELSALRASLAPAVWEETRTAAPKTNAENQRSFRQRRNAKRHKNIAVLDMETNPFDNISRELIVPFVACLYSDEFETIVIWEEDNEIFAHKLLAAIRGLPDAFTIYAHNGGKFDFMLLIRWLRGEVSFKGRGIMAAHIGPHELRDSYHIIPERLANYKKDKFDYSKNHKLKRSNYRQEIIDYLINDCRYLLDLVKRFLKRFSFKISVGAAAMATLAENYTYEKVAPSTDEMLRPFFFGGRVQCISGAGYYNGDFKLYDVNSMYPFVMSSLRHPIGAEYITRGGKPNANTIFLRLECFNDGALLGRDAKGELTTNIQSGEFHTSKWEYETALELGLISDIKIIECIDNFKFTKFDKFVLPLYAQRAEAKTLLDTLAKDTEEYDTCKAEVLFLKLILNNAYGKFCQNPRRYREHYITDPGEKPPEMEDGNYEDPAEYMGSDYWIWSRPSPKLRFNNVGTGASITGGARAILMRAIHSARNPIYCDTDSLICEELRDHKLDKTILGAWDLEKKISELIIVGKKMYAYRETPDAEPIFRTKGINTKEAIITPQNMRRDLTWDDMLSMLVEGGELTVRQSGPTLTRIGKQSYIERRIRRTTPLRVEKRA